MSMPFGYVSPAQAMRDKAEYARQGIARGRSCVTLQYEGGILLMAPNPSSALHKISEIYDRIAFAAVGRYNEYETLRKAGITYADLTGYQFDRNDVTARGIANYYAQNLGTIFTENLKPFEVEIVVAEVGAQPESDQIYRITFDGSVTDEPGFVAFGGQAEQVSAALKEHYSPGMSLSGAFAAALAALSASGNGERTEIAATQLEVAILDRTRDHRAFRRIRAARLAELISESRSGRRMARGRRASRPVAPETAGGPGHATVGLRACHGPECGRYRPRQRPGRRGHLAEPALSLSRSAPHRARGLRPYRAQAGCPRSQRDVGVRSPELGCLGDGPGQFAARPAGLDDRVDDAELDRAAQAAGAPSCSAASSVSTSCRRSGGTEASVRRCRMRMAATAPITATSAPGQAKTRVAPSARQFIAM